MLGFLQKMFDGNDREVGRLENEVVGAVNALEADMEAVDDLVAAYAALRARREGGETLEALLPESFALTRESAKRYLGLRHYDVQLIGAAALHYGRIAEMKTGEGKTLVATLALVLNALDGMGSHLVTTNDYLARTGAEWMGPVYRGLGLTAGVIEHGHDNATRREMYRRDVTYITNSELGFDYLRDNMALRPDQLVLREETPMHYAIIDEVDSILIDEARTPLIISGPAEVATDKYFTMAKVAKQLERGEPGEGEDVPPTGDYTADGKTKDVHLTEQGIAKAEDLLKIDDIFSHENMELGHMLRQALRAKEHYAIDQQYVKDEAGGIVIVDEFTGRLMPGRRFGEGLHQAIEAKEGVKIERENQTLATVTYQNFFKLYDKIAGMTGTAKTDEKEFQEIYESDVLVIPTNEPVVRKDFEDVVYRTVQGKFEAVVEEIAEIHATGQPILVGTVTIEASETLATMLKRRGIPHEVLNAKFHDREAEIVSQAGRSGAVTISTNMAGRGTDIVLGGNPEALGRQLLAREGFDRYDSDTELLIKSVMRDRMDDAQAIARRLEGLPPDVLSKLERLRDEARADQEKVLAAGGLHIIGTERHEARRIDNQLRGRSGRQGDPGSSRFYVSFEDDLMQLFASERVLGMMDRLGMDDTQPIEAKMVSGAIERAQKRVEDRNLGIRKQLLEYDNVMSKQREVIYKQRRDILLGNDIADDVQDMIAEYVDAQVQATLNPQLEPEEMEIGELRQAILDALPPLEGFDFERLRGMDPDDATDLLVPEIEAAYAAREAEFGSALMRDLERYIVLQTVDQHWKEHLHAMDVLRQGIGLRGYGQRNPLQEYAFEGYNLFEEMKATIRLNVAKLLFRVQVQSDTSLERTETRRNVTYDDGGTPAGLAALTGAARGGQAQSKTKPVEVGDKVGRNDPCPCGSGKKYKHCHGRAAA
ncbi:MAG: preprotein translocase subunit SecA [Trueperaceae bacterium]|nr:preprotein translocase subunit SecA [Trueperaceae bacterium]